MIKNLLLKLKKQPRRKKMSKISLGEVDDLRYFVEKVIHAKGKAKLKPLKQLKMLVESSIVYLETKGE